MPARTRRELIAELVRDFDSEPATDAEHVPASGMVALSERQLAMHGLIQMRVTPDELRQAREDAQRREA